jgi:hypothetical protein
MGQFVDSRRNADERRTIEGKDFDNRFSGEEKRLAAVGVLRNRLWGFWLSLFLSLVTTFCAVFFLPLGGFDMLSCLFIVAALLVGRLNRQQIVP